MHHYTHEAAAISQFSSVEVERQHREHKLELPTKLTQEEVAEVASKYAIVVRDREAQERERAAEDKRRKGEIEALLGKERLLFRIFETKTEDRPAKVLEFFARLHGDPVIVAVRANRFFGEITEDNYVGHRSPGPLDRQVKVPNTETSSEVLERQGAAAFADADEPEPDDEDEAPVEFDGARSDDDDSDDVEENDVKPSKKSKAKKTKAGGKKAKR